MTGFSVITCFIHHDSLWFVHLTSVTDSFKIQNVIWPWVFSGFRDIVSRTLTFHMYLIITYLFQCSYELCHNGIVLHMHTALTYKLLWRTYKLIICSVSHIVWNLIILFLHFQHDNISKKCIYVKYLPLDSVLKWLQVVHSLPHINIAFVICLFWFWLLSGCSCSCAS